ncbi:cystathionine beta-lyase [Pelistega indica]|uniref:Cystathionine beta-lyase n=1 Tax=Pelistega indica TaxID=1414851 RepID=V8G1T1_9BURK|nr:cystathionine beta-lyase [Pelistega indica]ETD70036.1 cystathionine beta-lyase [Pelistega indica]
MSKSLFTKLSHLGTAPCDEQHPRAPVALPAIRTSTVRFNTIHDLYDTYKRQSSGERIVGYGRMGMDTHAAFEEIMCELEGGQRAFLAPSGLNAIAMVLLSFLSAGDHMLVADCVYGPVRQMDKTVLQRMNIESTFCSMRNADEIEAQIKPNTKVLYIESPGSLLFEMLDLPSIAAIAKKHNILLVTDNTWGSGIAYRPLELGADISVVAVTKYIGGHSDLLMGAVVAKDEKVIKTLDINQYALGFSTSADDVWLAIRGVRTIDVRMKRHAENALKVCEFFDQQPETLQIFHPAYEKDSHHALWKRDALGSNGMMSVALNFTPEQTKVFVETLELFSIGYSWGGYESLVDMVDVSFLKNHAYWNASYPSLVRLHIGLESVEDLIADLSQALDKARHHKV